MTRTANAAVKKLSKNPPNHCGEVKAKHPFALSDCCTLGLAEYKDIKALFIHEREIDEQLQKVTHDQYTKRIVFLDDFQFIEEKEK